MILEDRTIAFSPGAIEPGVDQVRVEILTFERVNDVGNYYVLFWKKYPDDPTKIVYNTSNITSEERRFRERFVKGLEKGDQFIVVYSGKQATSIYGPIDEEKFLDLR